MSLIRGRHGKTVWDRSRSDTAWMQHSKAIKPVERRGAATLSLNLRSTPLRLFTEEHGHAQDLDSSLYHLRDG